MKKLLIVALLFVALSFNALAGVEKKFDLSGRWNYRLDSTEVGVTEGWYNQKFTQELNLPGSLNTNNIGDEVTAKTPWMGSIWNEVWFKGEEYAKYRDPENTKVAFWLTPDKFYKGIAWYQKEIYLPESMANKEYEIFFERVHWQSTLWVDGKEISSCNSLSTPHRFNIGKLSAGKHTITISVDNKLRDFNPGVDAHSLSDNTQSNWNGVVGEMSLIPVVSDNIENVRILPKFDSKSIVAEFSINSQNGGDAALEIGVVSKYDGKSLTPVVKEVSLKKGMNVVEVSYNMSSDFKLWDEYQHNLYNLNAELSKNGATSTIKEQFGLRKLEAKDSRIFVNDRRVFMRGTLECCIFPLTGFPPVDKNHWIDIFETCKAHGLNHVRFHSWCPPKAAFEAADEVGLYLYVETASWSSNLGSGKGIDTYVYDESSRIIAEYGNHPSFCLFSYGNEPHGDNHKEYLRKLVVHFKEKDSRFLYTTASGWPAIEENDWHCLPAPRIQGWAVGIKSIINSKSPSTDYDWNEKISKTQPTISHEIGQWCVYPKLSERAKYIGSFKAKNFDIFEDRLSDNGLLHLANDFFMASGKLQALCYKADIEAALRTDNFGGFELLDLHDFPGQGSALVGVLDPFWDSKGYITPDQYSEFCNEVVPLARMNKLVYNSGDKLEAEIQVSQFSQFDIKDAKVEWSLRDNEKNVLYSGLFNADVLATGNLHTVGQISQIVEVEKPEQLELVVKVGKYTNRWNVWVYPTQEIEAGKVLVANELNKNVVRHLKKGGKVLLTPQFGTMKNEGADSTVVGFSTIFWNTMWTNEQAPHTLGVLCDGNHPALELFPTEYHSDYQWWDMMSKSNAIPLHKLGNENLEPIVRLIDDWFKARSLAMVVEMKIGGGELILCSADLLEDAENRLSATQLKKSLLHYMNSKEFAPKQEVSIDKLSSLFK